MRLARFGFATGTIGCPTYEAAPTAVRIWVPQRTRWFKGWLQSWLVHMRNPSGLAHDLGFASFVGAQVLFAGMVISALAHPFLVLTALWLAIDLALDRQITVWRSALLAIDIANIACGYASFLLLGWQVLDKSERKRFWRIVVLTPPYWAMMSFAAWRALYHLWKKPHHWEKTPHGAAQLKA